MQLIILSAKDPFNGLMLDHFSCILDKPLKDSEIEIFLSHDKSKNFSKEQTVERRSILQKFQENSSSIGFRLCSETKEIITQGWYSPVTEKYFSLEADAAAHCKTNGYSSLRHANDDEFIYWSEFN